MMFLVHCGIYQGYYRGQHKLTCQYKIKRENLVKEYLWQLESIKGLDN